MAIINGTAGADTLAGTAGDDEIKALAGNDVITSSAGADKIDGGVGTDTVDYSASAQGINVDVRLGVGLVGRGGDAEGDVLTNIESIIGSKFNDTFTSGADARATPTRFEGGAGNDIYYIDKGATPAIIELADGGNDEIRVSVINPSGTIMAANVERLTYIGDKAFKGYGNDSNNIITGGSGNDTLYGGAGADQFIGGDGYDTAGYLDSKVGVTINLKTGVHSGIATGDTYSAIEAISGSGVVDTFFGNGKGTDFDGGGGVDTVNYSGSAAGVNVDVRQGTGAVGTGGDAEGTTLTSIENIIGSAFNDTFTVGRFNIANPIRLEGGTGNDIYYVDASITPTIVELANGGNDEVRVSVPHASATLLADNIERLTFVGSSAFKGYGNASNNIITGGSGNDTLYGGAGADQFIGGDGYDTVGYLDSKVGVTINLKTGVHSGIATGDTYSAIEAISGSGVADTFFGNGNGTDFDGGGGVDTVNYSGSAAGVNVDVRQGTGAVGTGGDAEGTTLTSIENIIGSAFNDTFTVGRFNIANPIRLEGGTGNDIYYVDASITPTIVELANGGNDEVRVSVPHASATLLADNIERLTFVGSSAFKGYGNASNNIITGDSGNDTLYGGAGADQFIGGDGYDTVGYLDSKVGVTINLKTGVHSGIATGDTYSAIEAISGSGVADTFFGNGNGTDFDGGGGVDTVNYSGSAAGVNVDVRQGTGAVGTGGDAEGTTLTSIENIIGSAFNDTFTVGRFNIANPIRLEGGTGNDIYYVDASITPTIVELANGGNDEVRVSVPHASATLLADNIERLTFVGSSAFKGYGNANNNIITGGSGNDTLYGGAGADQFIGGDGYDTAGYLDSKVGVTINLKTGVHTDIATGDTYSAIEAISGSGVVDTFFGNGNGTDFDGGGGVDTVNYSGSAAGVNVDVRQGTGAVGTGGDAEGTTLTSIENIIGSAFNDTFTVGRFNIANPIRLEGGTGNDIYYVDASITPTIVELANGGNDEVRVSVPHASATLLADNIERLTFVGSSAFKGYGNANNNIITGGSGNDTLYGGAGADQFIGGDGYDTAGYLDSKVGVTINLKTGVHTDIATGDTYSAIEAISGSGVVDTFFGNGNGTDFDGGGGVDTVNYSGSAAGVNVDVRQGTGAVGTGGDAEGTTLTSIENIIGSAFNDTFTVGRFNIANPIRLEGGTGNDIYYVDASITPTIVELANGGNDEVRVSVPHASATLLADNIERLTFVGSSAFKGYGNASNNIITGGSGNDTLYGGAGADQFIGGDGYDTAGYLDSKVGVTINLKTGVHTDIATGDTYSAIEAISGSGVVDTFFGNGNGTDFDGGGGVDTVNYSGSAAGVNVDVRQGTGAVGTGGDAEGTTLTSIENIIGSAFNDTFTVGRFNIANPIRLEGGTGNDIYYVDASITPTIVELANGGNDEVRVSVPHASATLLADNIERLTFVGSSAFKGYGNASNNIITGDSGNDTLYGGAGADQFIGGDGYDTVGYLDSKVAMTIDLKTGVHSGIASGDTYTSIEAIGGSNFNDIFYAASSPMGLEGASGTDLVTYVKSNSAVTIDLNTGANAGDAAGDTYTAIEIFQGSNFNDTLSGSRLVDIFVGGAGADSIDGREGLDSAWYITSTAGVTVNLQTQVNTGGDAAGDVLTNIERVVGSHFNDTLTGDAATNYLEGGLGNDVIRGGDGNDYLYGGLTSQIGPFTLAGVNNGPQADVIYGGNGNDTIVTAADDRGSKVYGEAGGDVITVASGTADGGEGNDLLTGTGLDFSLLGGAGDDRLVLKGSGLANGGQGNDMYTADTAKLVTIQDDGTSNGDTLILSYISYSELMITKADNDLYFHRSGFAAGETPQDGVRLKDWFNGYNTIEELQTADGQLVMLTGINSEIAYLFG